jgi:hypothetical protein
MTRTKIVLRYQLRLMTRASGALIADRTCCRVGECITIFSNKYSSAEEGNPAMLVQALGKLHDLSCAVIGPTTALRTTDHDENILSTLTLLASVCKMSYAASIHVTLSCTGASSMK